MDAKVIPLMVVRVIAVFILMGTLCAQEPQPSKSEDKGSLSGGKTEVEAPQSGNKDPRIAKLPPHLRQKVSAMAPDDRDRFLKNMERWTEFGDAERKRIKDVGRREFNRVREEMDKLADELGLPLDSAARKRFQSRYQEERRKVEHAVFEQMKAMRKPLIEKMDEALRKEFSNKSAAEPVATPAAQ